MIHPARKAFPLGRSGLCLPGLEPARGGRNGPEGGVNGTERPQSLRL